MEVWEARFRAFLALQPGGDVAHGLSHIRRVVKTAKVLAVTEGADLAVVTPAAWLHDCVHIEKASPLRSQASRISAQKAEYFLKEIGYPAKYLADIRHAIEAHSFTANIPAKTIEAKVVQDADRLDSIGAVGLARCLMLGGAWNKELYSPEDPFCTQRPPDDTTFTIDHFYTKLLLLPNKMQTEAGRQEGKHRADFLMAFLTQLALEV
ncbi:MAG TPA: HD domain-containing protein [Rhodothermales bacterium]|nr:HD domain-containing protein [Rhodothermales bacterium]HRR07315.1 HD domain-containing protein [Rhodothermales bacterium]